MKTKQNSYYDFFPKCKSGKSQVIYIFKIKLKNVAFFKPCLIILQVLNYNHWCFLNWNILIKARQDS